MIEAKEIKKIIAESISIIIISSIIAFAINLFNPNGFIFISREEYSYKKIVYISTKEAKIKYDSSSAIFIDSRSVYEFSESHIKDAINIPSIPISQSLKMINKYFNIIKQPKELVIYCTGTSCGTSEELGKQLISMGYSRHIYIIKHGFPEWREKGYPIENAATEEVVNNEND